MDANTFAAAAHLVRESRTPLISIPERPSTDAVAAALALLLVLERRGQRVKVVSPRFKLPASHAFLPKSEAITHNLTSLRDFILTVSLKRAKLETLRYDIQGQDLRIYLTPKTGFFEPSDLTTTAGAFAHDAIILLDAPKLEALGQLHTDNPEFFYHTPILNIDHHTDNARFGHVNLVDVVATSVSEIVFELIKTLGSELINEQVATTLLAGMMSTTKAFQSQRVTPRSLAVASHLVAAGAQRETIIRHLYQTRSVATLRLWGRALSRLETNPAKTVVWTEISAEDLHQTGATLDQAAGLLDELLVSAPGARFYCLLIEGPGQVEVHLVHPTGQPPAGLPEALQSRSPEMMSGSLPGQLAEVRPGLIERLSAIG